MAVPGLDTELQSDLELEITLSGGGRDGMRPQRPRALIERYLGFKKRRVGRCRGPEHARERFRQLAESRDQRP